MASYRNTYQSRTSKRDLAFTNPNVETATRQCQVSRVYVPDKVVGPYTTFPDGSKFRRSTNYARMLTSMEPGPAQFTQAINTEPLWKGKRGFVEQSPGGYRSDDLYAHFWNILAFAELNNINSIPNFSASGQNEANTKALLKIADQKVNLGENLATFHQTVGLLRNPLSGLIGGLRRMHANAQLRPHLRKSFRQMTKQSVAKSVANLYLQYIYGLAPLMSDIYGLIELGKETTKRPLLLHSHGTSVREPTKSEYKVRNVSNTAVTKLLNLKVHDRTVTHIWARLDPNYSGSRALNQLGLLNPASLAWELVPWSFVIDWVLPIGSVLQALTAPAGLLFVSGSTSRKFSAVGQYEHWQDIFESSVYKYDILSDVHAGGQFSYRGYNRKVLSGWPSAGLWIDPDPLRGDRWLKATALAISNLKFLR